MIGLRYIHTFACVDVQTLHRVYIHVFFQVQIVEPDVKKVRVKAELPYGHAILNDSHNVEWHVKLAADTELELKLVYTVEHPPQDRVDGLPKL